MVLFIILKYYGKEEMVQGGLRVADHVPPRRFGSFGRCYVIYKSTSKYIHSIYTLRKK